MTRIIIAALAAVSLAGAAGAGVLTDSNGHPITDERGRTISTDGPRHAHRYHHHRHHHHVPPCKIGVSAIGHCHV